MRILLSTYACEPNKGSEPGVGWNWAHEIARLGHDVWVLTRENNRAAIEAALAGMSEMRNLHFLYYDLPRWARWWKRGNRRIYLYYFLSQWGAYRLAREVHARERFDRVHHVTFVTVRQPSFMGNLGVPFTFDPVAGGERAPWSLRSGYGPRGWLLDALRDLANFLVRFDPLMRRTFRQAERIYVTSEQTLALLPRRYQGKAIVHLAVGSEDNALSRHPPTDANDSENNAEFRVLCVGRFLYWKGMHLGLRAFARVLDAHPNARLTLIGQGPDEARWRKLANRLGISEQTAWIPWILRDNILSLHGVHDVVLFPSLHDSAGWVVLEAMALGVPVVCLDLGGPGVMVDDMCGRVIPTAGLNELEVSAAMGEVLLELARDPSLRARLAKSALQRAEAYNWTSLVTRVYPSLRSR